MNINSDNRVLSLVSDGISEFLHAYPEKSINWIAAHSGVNKNRVYKFANKEASQSFSVEDLLSVVETLGSERLEAELKNILVDKILRPTYSKDPEYAAYVTKNDSAVSENFEKMLLSVPGRYLVYECCSHPNGVSRNDVEALNLDCPLDILDELVQLNMVFVDENDRYHAFKKALSLSFETAKKQLDAFSDCYNPNHVGKEINYFGIKSMFLNREGVKKAQSLFRKLHNDLRALQESNQGDHHMVGTFMFDTISDNVIKENK